MTNPILHCPLCGRDPIKVACVKGTWFTYDVNGDTINYCFDCVKGIHIDIS